MLALLAAKINKAQLTKSVNRGRNLTDQVEMLANAMAGNQQSVYSGRQKQAIHLILGFIAYAYKQKLIELSEDNGQIFIKDFTPIITLLNHAQLKQKYLSVYETVGANLVSKTPSEELLDTAWQSVEIDTKNKKAAIDELMFEHNLLAIDNHLAHPKHTMAEKIAADIKMPRSKKFAQVEDRTRRRLKSNPRLAGESFVSNATALSLLLCFSALVGAEPAVSNLRGADREIKVWKPGLNSSASVDLMVGQTLLDAAVNHFTASNYEVPSALTATSMLFDSAKVPEFIISGKPAGVPADIITKSIAAATNSADLVASNANALTIAPSKILHKQPRVPETIVPPTISEEIESIKKITAKVCGELNEEFHDADIQAQLINVRSIEKQLTELKAKISVSAVSTTEKFFQELAVNELQEQIEQAKVLSTYHINRRNIVAELKAKSSELAKSKTHVADHTPLLESTKMTTEKVEIDSECSDERPWVETLKEKAFSAAEIAGKAVQDTATVVGNAARGTADIAGRAAMVAAAGVATYLGTKAIPNYTHSLTDAEPSLNVACLSKEQLLTVLQSKGYDITKFVEADQRYDIGLKYADKDYGIYANYTAKDEFSGFTSLVNPEEAEIRAILLLAAASSRNGAVELNIAAEDSSDTSSDTNNQIRKTFELACKVAQAEKIALQFTPAQKAMFQSFKQQDYSELKIVNANGKTFTKAGDMDKGVYNTVTTVGKSVLSKASAAVSSVASTLNQSTLGQKAVNYLYGPHK